MCPGFGKIEAAQWRRQKENPLARGRGIPGNIRKEGKAMEIPIIYEDNHLLVVNKPVNLLTQADRTGDRDLLSILKQDLKVRYNKPGNVYLGLVHRLDRPVGGVMILAKTSKAAARLSEQVRNRELEKLYLAVVHGRPKAADRLVHYLVKDARTNTVAVAGRGEGKEAVLEYRRLRSAGGLSLVEVNLVTGRPHQVRVQFAAIGHPLYGDQKYGAAVNTPGQQLALFCHQISCLHPTRRERMTFTLWPQDVHPWSLLLPR